MRTKESITWFVTTLWLITHCTLICYVYMIKTVLNFHSFLIFVHFTDVHLSPNRRIVYMHHSINCGAIQHPCLNSKHSLVKYPSLVQNPRAVIDLIKLQVWRDSILLNYSSASKWLSRDRAVGSCQKLTEPESVLTARNWILLSSELYHSNFIIVTIDNEWQRRCCHVDNYL